MTGEGGGITSSSIGRSRRAGVIGSGRGEITYTRLTRNYYPGETAGRFRRWANVTVCSATKERSRTGYFPARIVSVAKNHYFPGVFSYIWEHENYNERFGLTVENVAETIVSYIRNN